MGRNHRHKKDVRAEKAKVKLKQSKTKFLPKGQNVTNTTFKIKPIVVNEQLKDKSSEDVLSKRKLNIKDLLSRIKHYNENVRHSACEELTEMIKVHAEEIVQQHLMSVCLAVSGLMQDREKKVRKSAVKCVETILGHVSAEHLHPFFEYFSTNLRCAMTNIDKNIQEDSLLFLDCFIKGDSSLIYKSYEKLLPDFLSLISKLRSDSQLGRTLTLNLGSKMTSVTWRIKVLSRLHAVLKIILKNQKGDVDMECEEEQNVFDASTNSTFPLYNRKIGYLLEHPCLDIFSSGNNIVSSNSDSINRHIVTLVPLLYETWLEVMPEQKVLKSSESTVLTEEMAALLSCITNTLYLLWQYIKTIENDHVNQRTVFLSQEGQKFLSHLLENFPYCHTGLRSKKSKNSSLNVLEHNTDPKCVQENLTICFLYLTLYVNCTQKNVKKDALPILEYLIKIFFQKQAIREQSLQCLLELLTECLGENYKLWQKSDIDLQLILENAIAFYNHGKMSDRSKLKLLQILAAVLDNDQLKQNVKYQNWLATLPDLLCQPCIMDNIVAELLKISKKNCHIFYAALLKKLPVILDNLDTVKLSISSESLLQNEATTKRDFAFIFYYLPEYSRKDLEVLTKFIAKSSQTNWGDYFKRVLALRESDARRL
ncbi:testis-expressed protein 10 homolog [Anthonomus grandis grandis]|uniref:testis-expressed protein 10 homolog n=1 Tax=Anthonomus grandis grandis TaxID=2921223 RepID=UPI002164FE1D|nr:testis-expressed protein 10 homolog [Anthonomus grandis grandis]